MTPSSLTNNLELSSRPLLLTDQTQQQPKGDTH